VYIVDSANSDQYPSMASSEDRDESKPLPSWRKTRFNRNHDGDQTNGRSRDQQRRFSVSCDDDHHSVRSEGGGNLRLYSIHDRRKHSQERIERNMSGGGNYNSIVNSNWDQRDRDDRSERSYISNYERGNNYKRGGRFNNRNTYDKPPRFQTATIFVWSTAAATTDAAATSGRPSKNTQRYLAALQQRHKRWLSG